MPSVITKALDAASAADADEPSRSELIRRIVTEWLQSHGFLPAAPGRPLRDAVEGNRAAAKRRKDAAAQAGED